MHDILEHYFISTWNDSVPIVFHMQEAGRNKRMCMMAAEETYKFLKQHKGIFYSVKQIAQILRLSQQTTSRSLNIISRYEDISCEFKQLKASHSKIKKIQSTKRSWVYAYVG